MGVADITVYKVDILLLLFDSEIVSVYVYNYTHRHGHEHLRA